MAASRSITTLPNALCEFVRTTYSPDQPVNFIEEPMPRILKAEAAAADSKGTYFNRHFKPRQYRYHRVRPQQEKLSRSHD